MRVEDRGQDQRFGPLAFSFSPCQNIFGLGSSRMSCRRRQYEDDPRYDFRLAHVSSLPGCIARRTRQACVRSDTAHRTNDIGMWRKCCLAYVVLRIRRISGRRQLLRFPLPMRYTDDSSNCLGIHRTIAVPQDVNTYHCGELV